LYPFDVVSRDASLPEFFEEFLVIDEVKIAFDVEHERRKD
jgi:hypothetical protein